MEEDKKSIGYIVPHTHWDREWKYSLWKHRMLLRDFIDQLLEIMKNDLSYRYFLMDGQSVIIEDYLEVRPEKREEIMQLVKEGRIGVGPWYTLPDMYPLDGECLVRNLMKGSRLSEELGRCTKIGYTSFGWGQIAQLPQLFKGFDIDFVLTAKRVSKDRTPESEFLWESPDGTRVMATRLGDLARNCFFIISYQTIKYGWDYLKDNIRFDWCLHKDIYHKANAEDCWEDYFASGDTGGYRPDLVREAVQRAWDTTNDTVARDIRLLLSGCDQTGCQPELAHIIQDANKCFEDKEFVHATLEQYVDKLKELIDVSKLRVVKGELRDGPANACTANALATRVCMKQLNRKVQDMLLRRAEPLASVLALSGKEYPGTFLDLAWKYTLQSHPHDSINGVTQDRTADDVKGRLEQALEIGNVIYEKQIETLNRMIDLSAYENKDIILLAVNTLPVKTREIARVCVDIPREYDLWDFDMTDCEGNSIDTQHTSRREITTAVHDPGARPWPFHADRHIFHMDTGEIPAGGYKTFRISPGRKFDRTIVFGGTMMRTSNGGEISSIHNALENEYLRVEINQNGTLKLNDKSSGRTFDNLLYFEDAGDVGDYWIYYPPYDNRIFNSQGCAADIWCEDNGRLTATYGIRVRMNVPAYGIRPDNGVNNDSKRSTEMTELVITSYITLKRGSKRLDIKMCIDNKTEDHRVRVFFPTDINAEYSNAAGLFTVDKRPVMPTKDNHCTYYPEMQTLPQQNFVDISEGDKGFAIINRNVMEYEVINTVKSTLAFTLFRSVKNTVATDMRVVKIYNEQKGGQSLGMHEFDLAIFVHGGEWVEAGVYRETGSFITPLTFIQTSAHNGILPESASLFEIEGDNLVLSAFKKAADRNSYIIRAFNPTDSTIDGCIRTRVYLKASYAVSLNERREQELEIADQNTVKFSAGSQKIVSIEIVSAM